MIFKLRNRTVASMSEDHFKCMLKAQEFYGCVGEKKLCQQLKQCVLNSFRRKNPGSEDFTRIDEIIAGLKDCGLSTRVEYGENGQEASIKVIQRSRRGIYNIRSTTGTCANY